MTSQQNGDIIFNIAGVDICSNRLTSLALCIENLDVSNKNYVDSQVLQCL